MQESKQSFYRSRWARLAQDPSMEDLGRLSRQIAYSFMDYYLQNGRYERDYIDILCEMATSFHDPQLNAPAARAFFGIIVEGLCDDFEELQTETYNRVMAQVIAFCCKLPSGVKLNEELKSFGLNSEADLLARVSEIRRHQNTLAGRDDIGKILLLSRVTIGADVAITHIMVERLSLAFPQAQIVILGDKKLEEICAGKENVSIHPISYSRRGGLLDRLASWHLVLAAVRKEEKACPEGKTILIDPDSRLSQLGILPLLPQQDYYFFPSRTNDFAAMNVSMGELTNEWLNALLGKRSLSYPQVWPMASQTQHVVDLCKYIRVQGAQKLIAINFGVGGNPRKKVGKALEEKLLLALLQEPNTMIFLDKGFGPEETAYTDSLLSAIENRGYRRQDAILKNLTPDKIEFSTGILGLESGIGEMAALIGACDEYIGYDSACQHIAAAVKTPCITLFAGSNNMRFIRRWSAFGSNDCHIIHVDTLTDPTSLDADDILTRILHVRENRTTQAASL